MFSIFKSKKRIEQTIQAIHNEFDAAGHRLIEEAKEIVSGRAIDEKGDRLKKLGFVNSKAAQKNREIEDANRQAEQANKRKQEGAKWVQYYSQWYPHHKFITAEIVKEICEKYNLYCGDVRYYKADVPLKNVTEMEQFKLRQEDMDCQTSLDLYWKYRVQRDYMNSIGHLGGESYPRTAYQFSEDSLSSERIARMMEEKHYSKSDFKICAPKKDFDMGILAKKGRFLVPDPIVLQPVNGGFLIVTKWGLEASDELVVNEVAN